MNTIKLNTIGTPKASGGNSGGGGYEYLDLTNVDTSAKPDIISVSYLVKYSTDILPVAYLLATGGSLSQLSPVATAVAIDPTAKFVMGGQSGTIGDISAGMTGGIPRISKEEFYGSAEPDNSNPYPNGVYVQHIDGKLYTEEEWTSGGFGNDEANGVAVVADEAAFVVGKKEIGNMSWSSVEEIEGLPYYSDEEAANDFSGVENTEIMLTKDTSGAAYACSNYVFGSGDRGYLPAAGEWAIAYRNKAAINGLLTAIGGEEVASTANFTVMWSSTNKTSSAAYTITWNNGKLGGSSKSFFGGVRPFMKPW